MVTLTERPVSLVVGGTSGLGAAVCKKLLDHGHEVHFTYSSSQTEALHLCEDLGGADGRRITAHSLTLPDADRAPTIRAIVREMGRLDAVVLAAVVNEVGTATIANEDRFRSCIEANVLGAYQVSAVAAQTMAMNPGGGVVINISSILTHYYVSGAMGYIVSKAAIEALSHGFAKEWAAMGVQFTTVAPGPVRDTKLLDSLPKKVLVNVLGEDYESKLLDPSDVAQTIALIADGQLALTTGSVVTADAGISL